MYNKALKMLYWSVKFLLLIFINLALVILVVCVEVYACKIILTR